MNAWYVAALTSEVGDEVLFRRRILDAAILIYRKQNGEPAALHDRCPYHFIPLLMGKVEGDDVVCHYHGSKFDCTGQCIHGPHGNSKIPKAAVARSFPVVERDGFIWL